MDIESLVKIGTFIAAVIALPKVWREVSDLRFARIKGDFDLVKDFISSIQNSPHPLVVEAGYRALYRNSGIDAPEILYLISLARPTRALRLFNLGRNYLKYVDGVPEGEPSIGFADEYTSETRRRFLKRWYVFWYFVFAAIAFTPAFFARQLFGSSWQMATSVSVASLLVFGWIAASSIKTYGRILASERFVEIQRGKH